MGLKRSKQTKGQQPLGGFVGAYPPQPLPVAGLMGAGYGQDPLSPPSLPSSGLPFDPITALIGLGATAAFKPSEMALERRGKRVAKIEKEGLGDAKRSLLAGAATAGQEALESAEDRAGSLKADFQRPQSFINQGVDRNQLDLNRRLSAISRHRASGLKSIADQERIARHRSKANKLRSTIGKIQGFLGGGIGAAI